MKKIAVFCGHCKGKDQRYLKNAQRLGLWLGEAHIGLVYGGGSVGMMGALANGVLKANGHVWGVIPKALIPREMVHNGVTELIVTTTVHERKKRMCQLADAFIVLPGGTGTLEELFEVITWGQLKDHKKLCFLFNDHNFFHHLISHLEKIEDEGFVLSGDFALIRQVTTFTHLVDSISKTFQL